MPREFHLEFPARQLHQVLRGEGQFVRDQRGPLHFRVVRAFLGALQAGLQDGQRRAQLMHDLPQQLLLARLSVLDTDQQAVDGRQQAVNLVLLRRQRQRGETAGRVDTVREVRGVFQAAQGAAAHPPAGQQQQQRGHDQRQQQRAQGTLPRGDQVHLGQAHPDRAEISHRALHGADTGVLHAHLPLGTERERRVVELPQDRTGRVHHALRVDQHGVCTGTARRAAQALLRPGERLGQRVGAFVQAVRELLIHARQQQRHHAQTGEQDQDQGQQAVRQGQPEAQRVPPRHPRRHQPPAGNQQRGPPRPVRGRHGPRCRGHQACSTYPTLRIVRILRSLPACSSFLRSCEMRTSTELLFGVSQPYR